MRARDRRVQRRDLTASGASRRWHTSYLLANIFEAASGFAGALGGASYFLDQHSLLDASIGHALQHLAAAWSILYFLGGVLIVVGLLGGSLRVELAGLCLFFPAALTEGVAILTVAPGKGLGPGILFSALACASFLRGVRVWRLASTPRVGDVR